jgi:3-oxoacyl-[acyl-carrier protein] reductase
MAVACWKPLHSGEQQNMSVAEAMKGFPEEAGISRNGQPEEIAELLGFIVSPSEPVGIGPPE